MGRVFLAYDPRMDRYVALKTIRAFGDLPETQARQARERFVREARAAGRLLHPGIVTVFDAGEAEGLAYLAMEYVEGPTLDRFACRDALLPVPIVVELVAGVAEALDYAHRQGLVHRDVKPANLVRVGETVAKIMDFGLAKDPRVSVTNDGAVLGTPAYMSPEQVRGGPLDGRSDLFSLGVVLYELLTGQRPFEGESVAAVLYGVVHEEPPPASRVHPRVGPHLERFLQRALAKDPAARWPDGIRFARALREAAASDAPAKVEPSGAAPRPSDSAPRSAGPRRRSAFWAGVLAALAALGGFAAYQSREHWWPSPAPPAPAWIEVPVRVEPPDATLFHNGEPVPPGPLRLAATGPLGVIVARKACREARHALVPQDADRELVLVLDPVELDVEVDPGIAGAALRLNGEPAGQTPGTLRLDLCQENRIEIEAPDYEPGVVELPAGIAPLQARKELLALRLQPIPKGILRLPPAREDLRFYVDGEPVAAGEALELRAGAHLVRAVSESLFIDVAAEIEVPPSGEVTASLDTPPIGTLVVQTYPPNCRVWLRRPGGSWLYLDTTPLRRRLAAGAYELRIRFVPTGETRERPVQVEGSAPTVVRESFVRAHR